MLLEFIIIRCLNFIDEMTQINVFVEIKNPKYHLFIDDNQTYIVTLLVFFLQFPCS